MTIHIYHPIEWQHFQQRLIHNHPALFKAVNALEKDEAIAYLNLTLGTEVNHDALLSDAGRIFLNALLKREGTIVLLGGGFSK